MVTTKCAEIQTELDAKVEAIVIHERLGASTASIEEELVKLEGLVTQTAAECKATETRMTKWRCSDKLKSTIRERKLMSSNGDNWEGENWKNANKNIQKQVRREWKAWRNKLISERASDPKDLRRIIKIRANGTKNGYHQSWTNKA